MITEKELLQAIRECESEPVTASKIGKLANFYIIYDHLFGNPYENQYSFASEPENHIKTTGESVFLRMVDGKKSEKVLEIMDELMEAIKTLHPKMYDRVLEKISDI